MPICTTCTHYTPHLYTVYSTANNLRLEQCSNCHTFADPYVEHDSLTLLLDLILLKRGVYRHLLYNWGTEPRVAGRVEEPKRSTDDHTRFGRNRERKRWLLVARLGSTLVSLDAFIRWSYFNNNIPPWSKESFEGFLRILFGCFAETLAFHLGIMTACSMMLRLISWTHSRRQGSSVSDIKREFRYSLIPLTLFYSSLTKLFLLFLLTIWRPTSLTVTQSLQQTTEGTFLKLLGFLDDGRINREWAIRNALGGMSAGFGLRVVLDIHPVLSSLIILVGWGAKTMMTGLMSEWVGGNELASEAWKAYSIP